MMLKISAIPTKQLCDSKISLQYLIKDCQIILIKMHSIAPQIIKHYIPLQFSKNVLDFQGTPKPSPSKKDQNPLQNMKLRGLDNKQQKQLILTFKNKSNPLYRSKKSLKYQNLFQRMGQQQQKLSIIKETIKQSQKNETAKQKEIVRISNGSLNFVHAEEKSLVKPSEYLSYRNIRSQQVKRRSCLSNRRKETMEDSNPIITGRLHSSINFRESHRRIIAQFSKNSEIIQQSPTHLIANFPITLKIRGRQAPERQVVDHLKRSSTSSTDIVSHVNKFDKK